MTDPVAPNASRHRSIDRRLLALINDPRDLPFVHLMISFAAVQLPFAAVLFVPGVFRWWMAVIYTGLLFAGYFDRLILMLHNTSHRMLFKKKYGWMNRIIPWVLCPFFGQSPDTYFCHHLGMHHPENNLEEDLSSTMAYRRDNFVHFLHYYLVFVFTGIPRTFGYLARNRRERLARKLLIGELAFFTVIGVGLWLAPAPTCTVFVIPWVMARFLMMWGNWGQHAFIDTSKPDNLYRSSITCINSRYNRRCFNDGYHIGHHVKASRHWTELPQDLVDQAAVYEREEAIVFEGIDFFVVSLWLFLGRHDWLAERFVDLRAKPRSRDEIVALLRSRLVPIPPRPAHQR